MRFDINFQVLSFPGVLTYVLGTQKKRLTKNALSIHNICRFQCVEFIKVYLSTNNRFWLENKKIFDNTLIYRPVNRQLMSRNKKKTQLFPIYRNLNRFVVLKAAKFLFFLLIDLSMHGIPFLCGTSHSLSKFWIGETRASTTLGHVRHTTILRMQIKI